MKAAAGFGGEDRRFVGTQRGVKLFETKHLPAIENGAFLPGFSCPWKEAGVWGADNKGKPALHKKNYFSAANGKPVSFTEDFYKPFQKRFIAEMEKKHDHYLYFVDGPTEGERVSWKPEDPESAKIVDAFHWYDAFPLLFKKWIPSFTMEADTRKIVLGKKKTRASFTAQLKRRTDAIRQEGLPALLGEFGTPFDMEKGKSYRTGDYSGQFEALSAYYDSLDELLLSCTLWNYTAFNTHAGGDGWNKEDLSIFCSENRLLRAEKAYCRPFAMAVAGKLFSMKFARSKKGFPAFEMEWESEAAHPFLPAAHGTELSYATEIFVPSIWFPRGWKVERFDGVGSVVPKPEKQRLFIITLTQQRCFLRITSV
jgi:hypothetical protein